MAKILGAHIPLEPKNLAINGTLDFWQRVGSNTTTLNAASGSGYTADMLQYSAGGATSKNFSVVQSATVPTLTQSGFESNFSYLFTVNSGFTAAASDFVETCLYRMEGYDYERIHTKTVTFGFWCQASVAGTYSFALRNSAINRSYVTTFSITTANTWQFVSITVTLDNTGTWLFTNGTGLNVDIASVSGSTYQTSTLGSWQAGNFLTASTAPNWQATTGATFYITQISLVEGSLGFGSVGFLRAGKTFQQELSMCQRYFASTYNLNVAPGTVVTDYMHAYRAKGTASGEVPFQWGFPVTIRDPGATAVATFYSPTSGASGKLRDTTANADIVAIIQSASSIGVCWTNNAAVVNGNTYAGLATIEAGL